MATINLGYRKVQVGEVILDVESAYLDEVIQCMVENGYICEIEAVGEKHWQISIYNKVNPNER